MKSKEIAAYTLKLKSMSDEQLFAEWSTEYDAKRMDHVTLIVGEMDERKLGGVIAL